MAITTTELKRPRKRPPGVRQIRRAAGIKQPVSAIALLKADHREAEGLFKEFDKAKLVGNKRAIATKVCAALTVHMYIEEHVFYPAFIEATGAEEIHNEALVEHSSAKKLIVEIEASGPNEPLFDARVVVLSEMIKHHVREEERFGGMFSKARRSRMDLYAVGALLQAEKQKLESRTKKPTADPSEPLEIMGMGLVKRKSSPRNSRKRPA